MTDADAELTHDQKAIHFETWQHIHEVQKLLHLMQTLLGERALEHDSGKIFHPEEFAVFAEYTPLLKDVEYGSDEYKSSLERMGSAIQHHQRNNRHHPEMFENGIDDMNLVDLVEMFCDWKAATLRSKNGNIRKSIDIQQDRFGMSDQLVKIFKNTIDLLYQEI